MSWVRIADNALSHPKLAGLVRLDHPFDLWVWSLTHSQAHITDGLIVREAVGKRSLNAAAILVARGLWETHTVGWKVHDYLDWNDCREVVLERQERVKEQKAKAKERYDAWLQRRRNAIPTPFQRVGKTLANGDNQTKPNQTNKEKKEELSKKHSVGAAPKKAPPDPRVKEFLLWFQSEYKSRRFGADYCVSWAKHAVLVKEMLGATNYERLQTLAKILLSDKTDDPFIVETDRGIEILKAKFNWLSDRLAMYEARQNGRS